MERRCSEFAQTRPGPIEISVPPNVTRRPKGIVGPQAHAHQRDRTRRHNIPVTTIACTIIDLATRLDDSELERAISEATSRHLTTPDHLLSVLNVTHKRNGAPRLRNLLTRHSFRLTDSELERIFIPLSLKAGLPVPETRTYVNGFKVDFSWPALGLVVETDSLTFHRDPFQQRNDRLRDQAHTAAGLTQLRFTHWQVKYDPRHVQKTLRVVGQRLLAASRPEEPCGMNHHQMLRSPRCCRSSTKTVRETPTHQQAPPEPPTALPESDP